MTNTVVAIEKCFDYDFDNVFSTLEKICSNSAFPDVKNKKVLIKPNILSDSNVEDCITTHPILVKALIRLLKNKNASLIYVGDSPGLHNQAFCAKNCGIYDVCLQEGATWVDFSLKPVIKHIEGTYYNLPMANILDKVDVVISLSKFKTHQLMYSTGPVKNLFGLIVGLNKAKCHVKCPSRESFARFIVSLHETVKPSFSIIDGIIAMEGPGPANGYPRPLNLLLASKDSYALDFCQALIMGYDTKDIPILNEARKRNLLPLEISYSLLNANNLICSDFERITVQKKTKAIRNLVIPFFTRFLLKKKQRSEKEPIFNSNKCIHCLRCVNICPAKAIRMDDKKNIVLSLNKCIRCYCCHEMCPVNAIEILKEK